MNIKRKIRVIKIFFAGHYRLIKAIRKRRGREFIKTLQLLTPSYYKEYAKKYGGDEFTWWLTELGKSPVPRSKIFHHYELDRGQLKTTIEAEPPVTIQLNKDNLGQS